MQNAAQTFYMEMNMSELNNMLDVVKRYKYESSKQFIKLLHTSMKSHKAVEHITGKHEECPFCDNWDYERFIEKYPDYYGDEDDWYR